MKYPPAFERLIGHTLDVISHDAFNIGRRNSGHEIVCGEIQRRCSEMRRFVYNEAAFESLSQSSALLSKACVDLKRSRATFDSDSHSRLSDIERNTKSIEDSIRIARLILGDPIPGEKSDSRWLVISNESNEPVNLRIAELALALTEVLHLLDQLNDPIEQESAAYQLRACAAACIAQIERLLVDKNLIIHTAVRAETAIQEGKSIDNAITRTDSFVSVAQKVVRTAREILAMIG